MTFCRPTLLMVTAGGCFAWSAHVSAKDKKAEETPVPIKALLVTGGCSHDYTTRKGIIVQGIRERVNRPIEWMVKHQGDGESDVRIPLFEESAWAAGYDIVVHDYCFPRVREGDYIDRILAPHRAGLPAVLIHGTMLSFPTPDDRWISFTGATIRGHDRVRPLLTEASVLTHPIVKGFHPRIIEREELYRVDSLAPGTSVLIGARPIPTAPGNPAPASHPVAWTNHYGPSGARVFASTLGNELSTLITPEYLDLLARGFLWALNDLSDSTTIDVPPDLSLKGLKIAIPETPLPQVGSNEARLGKASALASADSEGAAPGRAIDGESSTYWESDIPGPASWQVELPEARLVGAIAIIWKEAFPPEYLVEGSKEGRSWRKLAEGTQTKRDSTLSILTINPVELSHLRVSIPSTPPGFIPGIREFAVYSSIEEIPSGLISDQPDMGPGLPFRTVGESDFERKIRLVPGWSIAARIALEPSATPIQLIPTASGKTFLLSESVSPQTGQPEPPAANRSIPPSTPKNCSQDERDHPGKRVNPTHPPEQTVKRANRSVHLLGRPSDGTLTRTLFLDALASGTVVSWDGEWLYTFSGGKLDAYRNLTGTGPANERKRIGTVCSLPKGASPNEVVFSDMHQGVDGWFYVRYHSPRRWEAYDSRGKSVFLPERGTARFRQNGEGFAFWTGAGESGGEVALDDSGFYKIGQVGGHITSARDGRYLWTGIADAAETTIVCLEESSGEPFVPVFWDQIGSPSLFDYLESGRQSVRREAVPEILRRKRNPVSDIERVLSAAPSVNLTSHLLYALTSVNSGSSLKVLGDLCQSPDPALQALAFRHLGDHPLARNHPAFQQITNSTIPAVSVEIVRAILRSDTTMGGMDDLALSFTSHPDHDLAAEARDFLISREASKICFEVLDSPERKTHWRGAFDVLSELKRSTVVEGIVLRLEQTTSSEFRRLGLEALCRLYYRESGQNSSWEGTRIADLFLRGSLRDHRVDRLFLFNTMLHYGIPLPEPGVVADLAKNEIPLEPLAVETLLTTEEPLSPATSTWLADMAKSPNRDEVMRSKAGMILSRTERKGTGVQNSNLVIGNSIGDLAKGVENTLADAGSGQKLFSRLNCDTCHNIHGEGPSSAPDLASSVEGLSTLELIEALIEPSKTVSPGYDIRLFELKSGRQLKGLVEERDSMGVSLRDRAGNPFSIQKEEIRFEWVDPESLMPSGIVNELDLPEFAALIQFLKTLGTDS